MSDTAILVENLGKQYRIGKREPYKTLTGSLTDAFTAPFRRFSSNGHSKNDGSTPLGHLSSDVGYSSDNTIWALKDVSFEIKRGEVVGVIGRNGAGKSTLLKILSRITEPTEGHVQLRGRISSLLEVGTGFHPELTGRENIFLNGAVLGMKRVDIDRRFDEIVAFAEIEKFLDTPVKHYSSGMYMRLAFSVAAHLEPEILLVDEVLAVGDAEFQKKCLGKMGDVAKEGRTVLFVSHNMAAIEHLCNYAMLLDQGILKFAGTQSATISEYQRTHTGSRVSLQERRGRKGSGEVRIVGIELRDAERCIIDHVTCGQDFDVVFHYEAKPNLTRTNLNVSLQVLTQGEIPVFLQHNRMTGDRFGSLDPSGSFVCHIRRIPLPAAAYRIGYSVMVGLDYLDSMDNAGELIITSGDFFKSGEVPPISHGLCLVDASWSLES